MRCFAAGSVGMIDIAVVKALHPEVSVMLHHGALFVTSAVLIVTGLEFLAIGLPGELQIRHHHTLRKPVPYFIERIVYSSEGIEPPVQEATPKRYILRKSGSNLAQIATGTLQVCERP